ncbi:MAG: pyruvate:ferredoxin (flavodoxin) oxidoreductase [Acidimicrobiales bacterium]
MSVVERSTTSSTTPNRMPDAASNQPGSSVDLVVVDGNEAAARIAHKLSEVIAIYPITPASPMGELSDAWSDAGRANLWGDVPDVIEMQSEAGAAGTLHGALLGGSLATTFTASQGLLLMIPNLYKIAGEHLPSVVHVAARSVATHALSIFGDHSDVMACRQTGMAMLASGSVQEAHDLALVAHAATLKSRVPFLHFFDGFRSSHEINTIAAIDDATIAAMVDLDTIARHRTRALDPNRPVIRGTAQNPDVFFQSREAANPLVAAVPDIVVAEMDRLAALTGRAYAPFEYHGHPDADRVVVVMGSGAATVRHAVDRLVARGERVGLVNVRLYRPFDTARFVASLATSVTSIAVLDRTKEPGAAGEPLYQDVVTALAQHRADRPELAAATVTRGRYGLSSKEFTPAMVVAVLDDLATDRPQPEFTVGIVDDVTHLSLPWDDVAWDDAVQDGAGPEGGVSDFTAVFHGLGSDGTVGANKNTVKIVAGSQSVGSSDGGSTRFAQGYFVYDSKKSGSATVSHLRFADRPIDDPTLVRRADFVGVHHFGAIERRDPLAVAATGAQVLINSPHGATGTWKRLPAVARAHIVDRGLRVSVIDAAAVARDNGLGNRVNTVLQTCFFALTDLLPTDEAIGAVKRAIDATYAKRGRAVAERNKAAVDASLAALEALVVPDDVDVDALVLASAAESRGQLLPDAAPDFVQRFTARLMADEGDLLPVSAMPVDGTFPTATTKWEKRSIAAEIPIWEPDLCIDCARCALVCPHAAIRLQVVDPDVADAASSGPAPLVFKDFKNPGGGAKKSIIQVAPDDCTGCGVCVEICPAKDKAQVKRKAINMAPIGDHLEVERARWDAFTQLPAPKRTELKLATVKGSQMAEPLFEFSGACSGCGETPYVKLLSQVLGDRLVVANATGCSSIYGGNLPTTPWTVDADGRGPAWANSLFEDNAEFGLGLRLAADHSETVARRLLDEVAADLPPELADARARLAVATVDGQRPGEFAPTNAEITVDEAAMAALRDDVADLRAWLAANPSPRHDALAAVADHLVPRSVWLVGGDGWAYDIGFGGVDHAMASGRDINILVLDTEVYSNTGGQTSKATPRGAVAKFSAGGKPTGKKDLAMIAMAYGNVYVAHIAMGANMTQTVKALSEAAAHPGPSLVIAYSPCVAHGIDMRYQMDHQKMAADSGYWPLFRYDPKLEQAGEHGLRLDSRKPTIPFAEFANTEGRFAMVARTDSDAARTLLRQAQTDIDDRWHLYEQMVEVERTARYGLVDADDAALEGADLEGERP